VFVNIRVFWDMDVVKVVALNIDDSLTLILLTWRMW